jgi:hypothetical protein
MTYSAGNTIVALDYNTFAQGGASPNNGVANINTVWGVGNSDKGYGQSTTLSTVTAGNTILASSWSTMITRLNSILTHQSGTGSGITAPSAGGTITALANLSTKITDAYNNRLLFNNTRGTPSTTNYDATWNAANPTTFQQIRTVTFQSGDKARYFFNAGGVLGISLSVPAGGGSNSKETAWGNMLASKLGTLTFGYTSNSRSGTGGTLSIDGSALGYYDMTTTNQTLIRITETTSPYTANTLTISAKTNGPQGSNADNGTVVTFTIDYNDASSDAGGSEDDINFTVRAAVVITPPETTNLTDTWSTVSSATSLN